MQDSPRKYAHIGFGLVVIGIVVQLVNSGAYLISFLFWAAALVFGIIALVKNGRAFPSTDEMIGVDKKGLGLLGYIETYLCLLPTAVGIILTIYIIILKG